MAYNGRLRFIQDNDSHWYVIPADMKDQFWRWVESMEDDAPAYSGLTFDHARIDGYPGHFTFTDLKEDKFGM